MPECKVGKVSFQHAFSTCLYDLLHIATPQYLSDGVDESWGGRKVKVEQVEDVTKSLAEKKAAA